MTSALVPDVIEQGSSLPSYVPTMAISLEKAQEQLRLLQQFVQSQMVPGEDYGKIPGVDKPSLFKAGAEKLLNIYGFAVQFSLVDKIEDWEHGRFSYTYKATIVNKRTGLVEAETVGNANSMEARYRYNWVPAFKVPKNVDKSTLATRETKNGKTLYRLENEDPYTLVNTLMKMSQKRALVGATLAATRSSGIFTQDVEDMPQFANDDGQDSSGASAAHAAPTRATLGKDEKTSAAPAAERARIFALAKSLKISETDAKRIIHDRYGVDATKDMTADQVADMIQALEGVKAGSLVYVPGVGITTPAPVDSFEDPTEGTEAAAAAS